MSRTRVPSRSEILRIGIGCSIPLRAVTEDFCMNRFSSVRRNTSDAGAAVSPSFRSARAQSRRAASRASGRAALPAPRRAEGRSRAVAVRPDSPVGSLRISLCSALFALPVAAAIGLVLLMIAAGTLCALPDPDRVLTPLGLSVLGLTVLCGGFVCSRRAGCAPLLCGLLFGGLAVLAVFAGSLCFGDASRAALALGLTSGARAGLYAGLTGISCLGAFIGRRH